MAINSQELSRMHDNSVVMLTRASSFMGEYFTSTVPPGPINVKTARKCVAWDPGTADHLERL